MQGKNQLIRQPYLEIDQFCQSNSFFDQKCAKGQCLNSKLSLISLKR